ncbi:MAG: CBS domain-containing protein [Chloroflexi bacterium]|nr:CBS domain-containing protein [Chloroflexota bacterium]
MLAVIDIMTPNPQTVTPGTVLLEVLATMSSNDLRHVPVVDKGKLVGIISDRDLRLSMNSILSEGNMSNHFKWLEQFVAEQCMSDNPISIDPEASVYKAAALLHEHKISALPVVNEGELIGILTVTDLLGYLANRAERALIPEPDNKIQVVD